MNQKDRNEAEQAAMDATIMNLRSNKHKLWLFLMSAMGMGPLIDCEPGEVLLLYLGKDAIRIFNTPSSKTVKYFTDLVVISNEMDDPGIDSTDIRILKISADLAKFLLVGALGVEMRKRIHELEVVKDLEL